MVDKDWKPEVIGHGKTLRRKNKVTPTTNEIQCLGTVSSVHTKGYYLKLRKVGRCEDKMGL